MPSDHASAELLRALSQLHGDVQRTALDLAATDAAVTRELRGEVLEQLSDYVLPRLVQLDAPLLVVVGGSTGAGKSTLVNSLIGQRVTESGVLRPTTRSPVLVHATADAEWFQGDRVLPDLPRTDQAWGNDTYAIRLAPSDKLPPGLAILDAPDVDSIDEGNRTMAAHLLSAADLWLFVTSAARYADQVPWTYLRIAAERSTSVAVVLDRTHPDAVMEVRGHLARMMTSRGLSDSPLFTVAEAGLDADGLLPREAVADIAGWLWDLSADPAARSQVIAHTLDGAIRQIVFKTHDIADGLQHQVEAAERLEHGVREAYRAATDRAVAATVDGSLLRGDVLGRWQDRVSSGAVLDDERKRGARGGGADGVAEAVAAAVVSLVVENAEAAAEAAAGSWDADQAGRALVDADEGLARASHDLPQRVERVVRDWQQSVLGHVRADSTDVTAAGLSVALQVAALNHKGDPHPSVDVGRKLLVGGLGEERLVELVEAVTGDLAARVTEVVEAEQQRYLGLVQTAESLRVQQETLREAAREAEYARHTDFFEADA